MDINTRVDLAPAGMDEFIDGDGVPVYVAPEITVKVEMAMAGAAKLVEEAFSTAQAQALGTFFDALVDDGLELGDGASSIARAKRVMVEALRRIKTSRHDTVDAATKLYIATPTPGERQK